MPIIINSKFRPFSFQEMLQPVAMAAQAHQALEDSYSELDTKASIWEKLKDSEIDRDVYQQYKAYSDALRSSSDELAQFGLTPSSRRAMLDMRARYSQDIAPIEQAWNERDRQMKVQQEMMLKDPTHMYRVNAGQVGLREYMNNAGYDALTDNYSGALLTKQVGEAATNLKTALMDRSKLQSLGLPYQYERMLQYGATPEQVMQAMSKDPNALPILNKMVDDVMESSGIRAWGNDELTQRAEAFARQGLYNAIGTKKYENFKDDFSMQDELHKRQFARQQAAKKEERQLAGLAVNPLNIYTPEERAQIDSNIKRFSKYFKKNTDGSYSLTKEGLTEYQRKVSSGEAPVHDRAAKSGNWFVRATMSTPDAQIGRQHEARMNRTAPSEFRRFMDSLGIKPSDGKATRVSDINKAFGTYMSEHDVTQYDARKRTEFGYALADSQKSQMKGLISTAMTGLDGLEEVRLDGKSGQFVGTGTKLSSSDLKNDKYKVLDVRFSPYGSTVMIENDKGEVKRYRMPAGINPRNESNRDMMMQQALQWQNIVTSGTYTNKAGRTVQATPEEIAYAQQQYAAAIQKAYLYHSQLGLTNQTEEQKFNPYGY